jgi:hypothetical protein
LIVDLTEKAGRLVRRLQMANGKWQDGKWVFGGDGILQEQTEKTESEPQPTVKHSEFTEQAPGAS